ncbi:Porphyrin biosynthesis protein HemD [Geodia barretti]|uniref:Porphyrin biosynthesis protein HemD n=1 Tax=Geodia barretti TaxID=519541 RepID=A0AA35TH32_GEOBA|nr:Porphyrin biosynthesis protein HemD [Geodia barretti]
MESPLDALNDYGGGLKYDAPYAPLGRPRRAPAPGRGRRSADFPTRFCTHGSRPLAGPALNVPTNRQGLSDRGGARGSGAAYREGPRCVGAGRRRCLRPAGSSVAAGLCAALRRAHLRGQGPGPAGTDPGRHQRPAGTESAGRASRCAPQGWRPLRLRARGEEALALARHGISFEIVPGVSSAIAAPAYAGIPVTHRGIATGFTVVSGSEDPSKPESSAAHGGTLMTLMGWASIEKILEALQRAGLSADTPVALVQWGTWNRQRTVTGTLATAAAKGREADLAAPVVAVIGEVVSLRDELAWFDNRPLFSKRVLVTRSRTQASRMCDLLEDAGAVAVELPAIAIAPPEDFALLDDAVSRLSSCGWVIFASVNAVDSVFERLDAQGRDARAFGAARVGAIGPATATALERRGIHPDFTPSRSVSSAALEELAAFEWSGVSVLLPAADIGRDELADGLSRLGAKVERITAYLTITPPDAAQRARDAFTEGIDIVTFTSSSTVRNLLSLLEEDGGPGREALSDSLIACIGPVTSGTARELGLRVDVEAEEHTVEGLAEALIKHFSS